MRPSIFAPFTIAAVLLAAAPIVHAVDSLPPTIPGSPSAPAPSPGAATTPGATSPSQQTLGGNGKGVPGHRLETLKEELGLTPAQVEKIRPLFRKAGEEMKAVHNNAALSQEQKRQKMKAIFIATVQQMKPILTPAQLAKLKEMHKDHAKPAVSA